MSTVHSPAFLNALRSLLPPESLLTAPEDTRPYVPFLTILPTVVK